MSKKVLTVDDSKTLRMIVAKYLKPFGVEILEAENGAVGVTKAKADRPDLILLDYNMPVLDGCQTLEALKGDAETKGIPVIMLTTETVQETVIKLIKLGLKDFIAKPFSREALLTKLNPLLKLYEGDAVPDVDANPGAQAGANVNGKKTVLAVDDKENVLHLIQEFLGDKFHVILAQNGQTAISMIPSNRVDLLLLDMDMPDVSGIDVFKRTKASLEANHTRIVGMVLRTANAEISGAKQAGIRDFLYKPFTKPDVDALLATLGDTMDGGSGGAGCKFLQMAGEARILAFPAENDPNIKAFAGALGSEIPRALSEMADEGVNRLVIKLTPSVAADFAVVKKFISLMELVSTLKLSVKLVAEDEKTRNKLRQFSETAAIQTFDSIDLAMKSFA